MTVVVLLRGINVGKSVQVPMKQLKAILMDLGCRQVTTYLNSGNAVVETDDSASELTDALAATLQQRFGQPISVLVKTAEQIRAITQTIPLHWHSDPSEQTYVAYLFDDVDTPDLVDQLPIKHQHLTIFHTPGAIVWNIKRELYNKSQITKIASHPAYSRMTTRNINTARALAQLVTANDP